MIHHDGFIFIIPAWAAAILLLILAAATNAFWLLFPGIICAFAATFLMYFFRDPERPIPTGDNLVLSPADGKVILAEEREGDGGHREQVVSIFMSVFDVHVNRVPVSGRVAEVVHRPGRFYKAFQQAAMTENERTELAIESSHGLLRFSQVAGILARRIVCNLHQDEQVKAGDRFGLIRFGSRADLFLGSNVELKVAVGDRVRAGESIIGVFTSNG